MRNIPDIRREGDRFLPSQFMGDVERSMLWRPLIRQLDDVFYNLNAGFPLTTGFRAFSPLSNFEENDEGYLLTIDMPGLERDEIDLDVQGSLLHVRGLHNAERDVRERKRQASDSSYREYDQTVTLPMDVNHTEIEADYRNGVLSILIPKTAESKHHKIRVGEAKTGLISKFLGDGSKRKGQSIEVRSESKSSSH